MSSGLLTVVIGHATFCIVIVYNNLFRPNQAPIVNVVAATLVVLSIVPIYLSQRLSQDTTTGGRF